MPYAFSYDVPGDEAMYAKVKELIGHEPPKGLVVHLAIETDRGLRHIGVWDSQEDWQRFHDERSQPAVRQVLTRAGFGEMPPDPPLDVLKLVDLWLGS